MKAIKLFFILTISLLFPFTSYCQEWLVEMNPNDGTFEAVGPFIEDVYTIYGGLQAKDEVNGHYIFMKTVNSFLSVDISNAEIIIETPIPTGQNIFVQGFHCFENCDSLILICLDYVANRNYVALLGRFNGAELIEIGDPNDNLGLWNTSSTLYHSFDPVNNHLYLYSVEASQLRVVEIPSGEIIDTYSSSIAPINLAFDEINNKLYALEFLGSSSYKLQVFEPALGEFIQIGENFTAIGGYLTLTIDGDNQRMLVTGHSASLGSYLMSIDIVTGELITSVQTVQPDGGPFGGTNAFNGQYFNSTDQLIALHWGEGGTVTSAQLPQKEASQAWIYPNPCQGEFKIHINGYNYKFYHLDILNLKGQVVYENKILTNDQLFNLSLPAGYFIANIFDSEGLLLESLPLIIDSDK